MIKAANKNKGRKQPTTTQFYTDFRYTSREDKPEYVWLKYGAILKGRILDVGADNCNLRNFLPAGTEYIGIGLGDSLDMEIDLEKDPKEANNVIAEHPDAARRLGDMLDDWIRDSESKREKTKLSGKIRALKRESRI